MRSVLMYGLTLAVALFINPIPASADGNAATVVPQTSSADNSNSQETLVPPASSSGFNTYTAEPSAATQITQEESENVSSNGASKLDAIRLPVKVIKTILMNVL